VAVAVPNGEWALALAPAPGWPARGRFAFGCAVSLVVAAALGALAFVLGREPARLRALVALRTAELGRAYEQLARDSDEHRRTEERLRHAQKMEALGQLAGGVAHDFNNVLTGILACATAIAEEAPRGSPAEEAARVIEQAGRRAAELTRQLLGFARRGKLRAAPVDVHAAVAEAARLLARTLDPRIVLVQRLEAAHATVFGDAGQLQQAILNLAVNARDALPRGGTVTFATSNVERTAADLAAHPAACPGRYVALSVADTGAGIPPELRERIFEPFFTTKEPGRGTGMGLATVYGIATNHGGLVELESEPDRGARFTLLLPVHDGAAPPARQAAPVHLGRPARVLVVDDDPAVRAGAARALAVLRCAAEVCETGAGALAALRADPSGVDLAIVDLGMPGMDGLATFRALRAVAPALPVVVSSGYGADGRAQEVLDAGACGFLPKPWALDQLAAAISGALASRR
jgi:signal transduction histidine kinase/CheY-like chemotaxis protein